MSVRVLISAALVLHVAASVAPAQGAPSFELASVKRNTTGSQEGYFRRPSPGQFRVQNIPLRSILLRAFRLLDHQLIGAPGWSEEIAYDIDARFAPGTEPSDDEVRLMLQKLLADRFGLVVHRETRERPLYELVLPRKDGAPGPHLLRSDVDCEKWLAEKRPQMNAGGPSPFPPRIRPACTFLATRSFISGGRALYSSSRRFSRV